MEFLTELNWRTKMTDYVVLFIQGSFEQFLASLEMRA